MIHHMLAIWSLVPLPFLKPAWTSGNSQFMYCWRLAWRILSITFLACEMSAIVWYLKHFLPLPFFGIGMKTDLFQSCGHSWVFQICWHTECKTFTAASVKIWNSSTRIPSPPLALFIVMLSKPIWLHILGYLALGEWSHHRDYLGCENLFLCSSSAYSYHLFLISSAFVRSIPFLSFIDHWLDGRESEWTLGIGDGQGGQVCCDSRGHKELDTTEWLNWTET